MEDVDYPEPSSSVALEISEIEGLKAEVLVHSARASNLHTRLLHAFDALDESQRNHAQELRDLEKKYIRLERRYNRQTAALHTCAAEKDDLRESVLELVEKVEQSNDIRSWPFNRLQLTRSAGSPLRIEPNVRHSPTQEHLSYAGAIIERLRRERDEERVEHVLTREALQSRIDALEARLARRETELEYYNTHAAHPSPVLERNRAENTGSTSSEGILDSIPQGMTNEGIIRMLNATAARNRTLEVEIKTLFKRLYEARSLPFSTEAVSPPLQAGHRIPVHSPLSRGFEGAGTRTYTPDRSDVLSPRSKHDAYEHNGHSLFTPTPLLEPTPLSDEIDHHHGDDDIDPDPWVNLPLASTASGGAPSAQGYINSGVGVGDRSSCGSLPDPEVLGVHDPSRKSAIIAGLDTELEELTTQIDAFRLERERLTQMVAARFEYRGTQNYGRTSGNSSSSGSHIVRRTVDDPSVRPSLEGIDVDAVEHFEPPLGHGDNRDENEDVLTDRVKKDVFGTLEHRLNVVEEDCTRLRNEVQDLHSRVQELNLRCRPPPHTAFLPDEKKRGPLSSQDEYQGTQSDVEYLIDDDCSLFDPTPTLIPDTKSKIKDDGDDLHTCQFPFCEPMVDLVSKIRKQPPSSSSSHTQSKADNSRLSITSGLDPTREMEGLKLDEGLLDVLDGEVSMVLATPLVPSSLLDRDSSDESTVAAGEASHDGILFDYDIDQGLSGDDMELEGTSDRIDYNEVDDDPDDFVGMEQRDSQSRTINDDTPTAPSLDYSLSRDTSIDDDADDRSGHGDRSSFDEDSLEFQLPRDQEE